MEKQVINLIKIAISIAFFIANPVSAMVDEEATEPSTRALNARKVFGGCLSNLESIEKDYEEYFRFNADRIDPLDSLETIIIKMMYSNKVLEPRDWEVLYFSLWSLVNVWGIEQMTEKYGTFIQILKDHWPLFDPTFATPITEFGFFPNENAKVIRKVTEEHTVLIFGASESNQYSDIPSIYRVNILKDLDPDLLADMNNPMQLQFLPYKHFETIQVENIPYVDFFNSSFFQSVLRVLKDDGEFLIPCNSAPFLEDPAKFIEQKFDLPYKIPPSENYFGINEEDFFIKNGFTGVRNYRFYYLTDEPNESLFWVLKKTQVTKN
jgi:hypothetical protein